MDLTAPGAGWALDWRIQSDPATKIHKAIRRTLDEYRTSSYEAFAFDMQITPLTPKDPPTDSSLSTSPQGNQDTSGLGYTGVQSFLLKPLGHDRARKALVRLDPSDNETVEVRFWYTGHRHRRPPQFQRLDSWLRSLPIRFSPNREYKISDTQVFNLRVQHQQDWWASNGKVFPFLRLPLELREIIYDYCTGGVVEPYPDARLRNKLGLYVTSSVQLNHLKLNKQIYNELSERLYTLTTFDVAAAGLLTGLLSHRWFPRKRLRYLTLSMTHAEYFKFFGLTIFDIKSDDSSSKLAPLLDRIHITGDDSYEWWTQEETLEPTYFPSHCRHVLQQLDLQRLELKMPHPRNMTDCDILYHGFCQKKAVDLILEALWSHVKGLDVVVTGYVKKSQQQAFAAKAKKAITEKTRMEGLGMKWDGSLGNHIDRDEEGGVMLDGSGVAKSAAECTADGEEETVSDEVRGGREWVCEIELPMICECETFCREEWSAED